MQEITWTYCQENSDIILADGLLKLRDSDVATLADISYNEFGNYLISHKDTHYYIGEGKNIQARLKQQFKPNTSTFFKTYQKLHKSNGFPNTIALNEFSIRYIQTEIGRKEIEDFGIVNIATPLNKFQKGKRIKVDIEEYSGIWEEIQKQKEDLLKQGEGILFNEKYLSWFNCSPKSTAGLYVVSDNKRIIYIGESSNISERHMTHSSRTYFSALRRSVATDLLKYELKERNGKKKYLTDTEEKMVTEYLNSTTAIFLPVSFGRYELEEHLIKKYRPLLNRKGKKDNQ